MNGRDADPPAGPIDPSLANYAPTAADPDYDKNRDIYDHADDAIWQLAVYRPVHDGWHFANIGGRNFLDFVLDDARLGPDSDALDLCCGSGAAAVYLAERSGTAVTGLDINHSQIERAWERARGFDRLRFLQADAASWTPDRRYDLVFSLDSLTLIPDLPRLFGASRDALRSGGRVAVADVVAGDSLSDEMRAFALAEDGAVSLLTARQIAELVEAAGFADVEVTILRDDAVRAFTLIYQSVRDTADWHGVPADKIEDWRILSERYLAAFNSGELEYARIVGTAP